MGSQEKPSSLEDLKAKYQKKMKDMIRDNECNYSYILPNTLEHVTYGNVRELKHIKIGDVRGATVDKIVEWIGGQKSLEVRDLVVITYNNFCPDANELLLRIIKRFMIPWPLAMSTREISEMLKDRYKIIQNKILGFLQYWISEKWYEFTKTKELRVILDTWIEYMKKETEYYKLNSRQIQGQIMPVLKRADEHSFSINVYEIGDNFNPKEIQLPLYVIPYNSLMFGSGLLSYPTELIATQLALIDQDLFCQLRSEDFLTKKSARTDESATSLLIKRTNYFVNFLVVYLLKESSLIIRDALIDKYFDLARKSLDLHNVNCAYMIYSAFSTYGCMKEHWKKVMSRHAKSYKEFETFFSSDDNFESIRVLTQSMEPPCVPCFYLWSKDMDTISRLHPEDFLKENEKQVDLQRQAVIADKMKELESYQKVRYMFYKYPVLYNFLKSDFEACLCLISHPKDVLEVECYMKLKRLYEPIKKEDYHLLMK
eukprot:TRINITY_DN5400_c0_g1_i1.p1 TRINITY_DN5400_c0_g1~~TRINITY_DN5400_c0_g1_i1.p1  ORF type:complete len:509 (+),score=111.17 TRINITY_DN5400_c0_g1_i1:76-1527(+)